VLRAETTQENIQDWIELREGDPEFQLVTEEEIAAVIFYLYILFSAAYFIKFSIYLFFRILFFFINPEYRLIRMTPSYRLIRISESLLWLWFSIIYPNCHSHSRTCPRVNRVCHQSGLVISTLER
jgi:hypothetical protein